MREVSATLLHVLVKNALYFVLDILNICEFKVTMTTVD
jgi:hypothetical protein